MIVLRHPLVARCQQKVEVSGNYIQVHSDGVSHFRAGDIVQAELVEVLVGGPWGRTVGGALRVVIWFGCNWIIAAKDGKLWTRSIDYQGQLGLLRAHEDWREIAAERVTCNSALIVALL